MSRRIELHNKLVEILGSRNVYFQPPESIKMEYPCIVYERYNIDSKYADNSVYRNMTNYRITVIDQNPDSAIVERMSMFKTIRHLRHAVIDNLHQDTFSIYY